MIFANRDTAYSAVERVANPIVVSLHRSRTPNRIRAGHAGIRHAAILAPIEHGLSNERVESMNTKIDLMTRIAFGFKSPGALIALTMLSLGGHKPVLPGRT